MTKHKPSRIAAIFLAGLVLAAPAGRAHGLQQVEALDSLPPATSLVPAEGAGLFGADTGTAAGSGFVKRSRVTQFDAGYRDRMMLAPAVGAAPATVQVFTLPLFADITVKVYKTEAHQDNL